MKRSLCVTGTLTLVTVCLFAVPLGAQQGTVTGTVTTQGTGQPLGAVQVSVSEVGIGGLTGQDGRFALENVPAGTHTLAFQRIGYGNVTREITVSAGETLVQNVALAQQALDLDEIIITGTPGGTQRRAIGNSVLSVRASDITENAVVQDMQGLLTGRSPGLTFAGAGGGIGHTMDITIRGVGSFDRERSQPLIFVDGIRVSQSASGPELSAGRRSNTLNDFNPADIESIEIIKGPAAATLYGTEASAGVIQIITKRGAQGSPQFTASMAMGRNFIRDPQGRMGTNWACNTGIVVPCGPDEGLVPYDFVPLINYALHDGTFNPEWNHDQWPQKNIFQYGPSHSLNFGVRGGTETIRYFLSANYDYDEGPVYYNWNEALSLRANVGVVLSERFSLDVSTGFVSGETSYHNQAGTRGGIWDQMSWGQGYCAPLVAADRHNPCPRVLGFQQMVPTDIAKISSTREYNRFTGSGTLNFTHGSWFSSRAILGLDRGWDTNEWIHPIEAVQANVIQETLDGQVLYERPMTYEFTADWSATATLPVTDAWTTATSVGAQFYSRKREFVGLTGRGFASPLSRTVNQTPVTRASIDFDYVENKTFGLYVQEQLSWNDRLFLTGALRFDDTSTFGSDYNPEAYPKLSGAWVVSEESFWNVELVDELRVRAAWGKAGRQPSTFAAINTFASVAGPGGGSILSPSSIGNPAVGPERSSELELGFDIGALDGRIGGEFSWYTQRNEENLLGIALPPSVRGGGVVQSNIGRIDNWGWEAVLTTRIYQTPGISFGVDFVGAYKMNEIKELGDFPGNNAIKLGLPYPSMFGTGSSSFQHYVMDAEYDPNGPIVDPWGRTIQAYCDRGISLDPDPNADPRTSQWGVVTGGDVVPCQQVGGYQISPGPAFTPYTWSVTPRLTLANSAVQIHAQIDGAYGKIGSDGVKQWSHRYNMSYGSKAHDNPVYSAAHRLVARPSHEIYRQDFWKLREVGVRYQLPESLSRRVGAERLGVSFSGRELATLWARQSHAGMFPSARDLNQPGVMVQDVETSQSDESVWSGRMYPPNTSFHFRLDVSF